jgi:hypothetical protein
LRKKNINRNGIMNKLIDTDTSAPEELCSEQMSALSGGAGVRYAPDGATGTNHTL